MMTDDLLQQALKLPAEKKEELFIALFNDLSTREGFEEWAREIERRWEECERDPGSLISEEDAFYKARKAMEE